MPPRAKSKKGPSLPVLTAAELDVATKKELKDLCTKYGVAMGGTRKDLAARLEILMRPKPSAQNSRADALAAVANAIVVTAVMQLFAEPIVSASDPIEPTEAALWLIEALALYYGAEVSASLLGSIKVKFDSPTVGRKVTLYALKQDPAGADYVPMVEALAADLRKKKKPPASVSDARCDDVLAELLEYFIKSAVVVNTGPPTPPASPGPEAPPAGGNGGASGGNGGALIAALTAALQGAAPVAPAAVVAKFTTVEYNAACQALKRQGFPIDPCDLPWYSQIASAKAAVLNVETQAGVSVNRPQLPAEPNVQPQSLKCRTNFVGEVVERDTRSMAWDENGLPTIQGYNDVISFAARKSRSVYQVAQGHVMYWLMVLLLSTQVKTLAPDYIAHVQGFFVTPYQVMKLQMQLARIVGQQLLSAMSLDHLLTPLLLKAQDQVNNPDLGHAPWTADYALDAMIYKLAEHMHVSRSMYVAKAPRLEDVDPDDRRQKKPKHAAPPGTKAPDSVALAKCKTCSGNTSSPTGVCFKCRNPDAAKKRAKAPAAAAAAGVADGGGAAGGAPPAAGNRG